MRKCLLLACVAIVCCAFPGCEDRESGVSQAEIETEFKNMPPHEGDLGEFKDKVSFPNDKGNTAKESVKDAGKLK